jgi:hypothetical protein
VKTKRGRTEKERELGKGKLSAAGAKKPKGKIPSYIYTCTSKHYYYY